jgi:hypothetical protein
LTSAWLAIAGGLLWLLKHLLGSLVSQQVKGSVPDYTASKARAAARLLPPDLAVEYEEEWLAELKGPLNNKPLSALKYALGLRLAARRIAARSQHSSFRLSSSIVSRLTERVHFVTRVAKSLVVVLRPVWFGLFGAIVGLWFLTHNQTLVLAASGMVGLGFVILFLGIFRISLALRNEHRANR